MPPHLSLAQQLAQLNEPAPIDFDPEADITHSNDNEVEEQADETAREHYLDVGPSALRRLQQKVSDPKYAGVRVSRTKLEESDEEDSSDGSDGDAPDAEHAPMTSDEEGETSNDESGDNGEEDRESGPEDVELDSPEKDAQVFEATVKPSLQSDATDLPTTLKRTREEERKKGKAVARQLAMYDSLLDARIRLQKCVTSMNRLPDALIIPDYLMTSESKSSVNNLLSESLGLVDDLFELQEKLLLSNEAITTPARKRRKTDGIADEDREWDDELQEFTSYFAELESSFHPHLLSTLQKWSNKVLAIAPSALLPSNRTKFSKNNVPQLKSAVQLVDEALLDHEKLTERTRVWRGKGARLGGLADSGSAHNPNDGDEDTNHTPDIFDDTDFYQSLLRSVIDSRSGSASASLGGVMEDWRMAQQERKKSKRASGTVDTRASKGRKLRFEVHEKMTNFMAPAPPPPYMIGAPSVTWHESQIDELFASILGKGFNTSNGNNVRTETGEQSMDSHVEKALQCGFRVFG